MTTTNGPGFFGKIPSHGDFISRRVDRSFLDAWDEWLQKSIARSREQLENEWLDTYLTSPIWRFVLGAGLCGEQPYAGVLMPSVDKVGRYFPLTICVAIPKGINILQLPKDLNDWFDNAEAQALKALDEPFNLEAFDKEVESLDVPVSVTSTSHGATSVNTISSHTSGRSTHIKTDSSHEMVGPYVKLLNYYLGILYNKHSVWWTSGSHKVHSCMLSCSGLPPVDGFSAFLDGKWALWGWQQIEESSVVIETQSSSAADSGTAAKIPADWDYPV